MRTHELLQKWQKFIPEDKRSDFFNDACAVAHEYWKQGVEEAPDKTRMDHLDRGGLREIVDREIEAKGTVHCI